MFYAKYSSYALFFYYYVYIYIYINLHLEARLGLGIRLRRGVREFIRELEWNNIEHWEYGMSTAFSIKKKTIRITANKDDTHSINYSVWDSNYAAIGRIYGIEIKGESESAQAGSDRDESWTPCSHYGSWPLMQNDRWIAKKVFSIWMICVNVKLKYTDAKRNCRMRARHEIPILRVNEQIGPN